MNTPQILEQLRIRVWGRPSPRTCPCSRNGSCRSDLPRHGRPGRRQWPGNRLLLSRLRGRPPAAHAQKRRAAVISGRRRRPVTDNAKHRTPPAADLYYCHFVSILFVGVDRVRQDWEMRMVT